MKTLVNGRVGCAIALSGLALASSMSGSASSLGGPASAPGKSGCTAAQRSAVLRAMQAAVENAAPTRIDSLEKAVAPGGALPGWRLAHGYVVLSGAGAVGLDNLAAVDPMPPLLLYAPSDSSTAADWLDFDGPDDPYRLVGWGYLAPYTPGSSPPQMPCIAPDEWLVHEAGWHLKDGGMHLTPGASEEPSRPAGLDVLMWHPRVWDLHVWRGGNGEPSIAFANANARRGGRDLPPAAFFRMENGRAVPVSNEP
jgi:hypothetical protein